MCDSEPLQVPARSRLYYVSIYVIQRDLAQMKCVMSGVVVQHYIARHDTLHTPCGWHSDAETCSSTIFVM